MLGFDTRHGSFDYPAHNQRNYRVVQLSKKIRGFPQLVLSVPLSYLRLTKRCRCSVSCLSGHNYLGIVLAVNRRVRTVE
jgi:hypothetical protein